MLFVYLLFCLLFFDLLGFFFGFYFMCVCVCFLREKDYTQLLCIRTDVCVQLKRLHRCLIVKMKLSSYKWVVALVELGIFYLELCMYSQVFHLLHTSVSPNEDESMQWMVLVGVLHLAFWDSTCEYKDQMASANSHAMLPDDLFSLLVTIMLQQGRWGHRRLLLW